ncbi:MAG: hypothetical protein ACI8QC_002089 [Planctomycetota bacterium]
MKTRYGLNVHRLTPFIALAASLAAILALALPTLGGPAQEIETVKVTLRGTLLMPDGTPASQATLELRGSPRQNRVIGARRAAKSFSLGPEACDADGRVAMEFESPLDFRFYATARVAGLPEMRFRWDMSTMPTELDLGKASFEPACFLVGHVEDTDGELLVEGWAISAIRQEKRSRPHSGNFLRANPDPATGQFRIGPLPPGEIQLGARHDGGMRIPDRHVQLKAGQELPVTLVYEGPDMRRRIGINVRAAPLDFFVMFSGGLRFYLMSESGEQLQVSQGVLRRPWDQYFADVPPGTYTIEMRDPRFEFQRIADVHPGQTYTVKPRGSAALLLRVIDDQGQPVEGWGLNVDNQSAGQSSSDVQLHAQSAKLPGHGRIDGIIPGSVVLTLLLPGGGRLLKHVTFVEGETLEITWEQPGVGNLSVRVLDGRGQPAVGARVEVKAPGKDGFGVHVRQTDAEGRCSFEGLQAEQARIQARVGEFLAVHQALQIRPRATDDVLLSLPLPCSIKVQALLPSGVNSAKARIQVSCAASLEGEPSWLFLGHAPLDKQGQAHVQGLPSAALKLVLVPYEEKAFLPAWSAPPEGRAQLMIGAGETRSLSLDAREAATTGTLVVTAGLALELVLERMGPSGVILGGKGEHTPPPGKRWICAVGETRLEMAPGMYRVLALDPGGGWLQRVTGMGFVQAGQESELSAKLALHVGELLLMDEAGALLPNTKLTWSASGYSLEGCSGLSDARGILRIALPNGTYQLDIPDRKTVNLVWPAPSADPSQPHRVVFK